MILSSDHFILTDAHSAWLKVAPKTKRASYTVQSYCANMVAERRFNGAWFVVNSSLLVGNCESH